MKGLVKGFHRSMYAKAGVIGAAISAIPAVVRAEVDPNVAAIFTAANMDGVSTSSTALATGLVGLSLIGLAGGIVLMVIRRRNVKGL